MDYNDNTKPRMSRETVTQFEISEREWVRMRTRQHIEELETQVEFHKALLNQLDEKAIDYRERTATELAIWKSKHLPVQGSLHYPLPYPPLNTPFLVSVQGGSELREKNFQKKG